MKIFVCHYTPLVERKKFILNQLQNINTDISKDVYFYIYTKK